MSVTDRSEADRAAADPSVSPVGDDTDVVFSHVTVRRADTGAGSTTARTEGSDGGRVRLAQISQLGDRIFKGASIGSGTIIVLLVIFVGVFLLALALPSLVKDQANFLTSRQWIVSGSELAFGIAGLFWTTVLSSVLAMAIAVPISIGVALFLTHYCPKRIAPTLAFLINLLAAVPSIVFGLWGVTSLAPKLVGVSNFLSDTLGFIPLFAPGLSSGNTVFVASVVLAIMILPIVTALSRDVFEQTPRDHIEAALALGATRWEMITMAVLPYGRSGVISASMLGLGRALGETIAVLIILAVPAPGSPFNPSIFAGGETFASKIANAASEFDTPSKTGAYIASGLVLFVVTFLVNAVARVIADRGGAKS